MKHIQNLISRHFRSLFVILFCAVITFSPATLQAFPVSDETEISIITIGPYQPELYSAFGHSGIRVQDPSKNIDWMYDYGRFDFDQKNFYWNFARGKMLYSIGLSRDFDRVYRFYESQDRYILEQQLNLSQEEKQAFVDYLQNNYLPENREYFYNYVYDNCATRIRDVIKEVLGDDVQFNFSYVEEGKTVRNLMDDYLDYQPWGDLIIDIGLGQQIDRAADPETYMFLPDYVYRGLEQASVQTDSARVPLVEATNVLYQNKKEPDEVGWFTPFNFFIIMFFVVGLITNRNFKTGKRSNWVDYILFSVVGILGWWLTFLWFFTEHLSQGNWNLLWAMPLYIPLVFLLTKERLKPFLTRFFRFMAVLNLLTLIFWAFVPQGLHQALIPLLVTMMLRSFYISYDLGRIRFSK
jgi:hypothetical protein